MEKIINIFLIGLNEGIIWFPIVLTIGIIYTYMKNIDVSIDGIVIISSITFVLSYNGFNSLFLAFFLTLIVSTCCYAFVHFMTYKLKINNILAGVIFTLLLHSISVLIVSESVPLNYESLHITNNNYFIVIITISLYIIIQYFFNTRLGIKLIVSSDNQYFNSKISSLFSTLILYVISGSVLSIGVVLYSSNIGMARSGGSFEFLITSLCSYLFIDKLIEYFLQVTKNNISYRFYRIIKSPVFKAFLGSILFQIIVLSIIYITNNPAYWKMIFGLLLIFLVADYSIAKKTESKYFKRPMYDNLTFNNISFAYRDNFYTNNIFKNFTIQFSKGINIIWGSNGSGKTTLLKLINGFLNPDSGYILFNGYELSNISSHKRNVFSITQNPYSSLSINNTVLSNQIATESTTFNKLLLPFYHKNNKAIDNQLVSSLSGGQCQRLNLDLCEIYNANIILADEPTSGMDNTNYKYFMEFLQNQNKQGKTVLVVTHDKRFENFTANHFNLDKLIGNGK